MLDPLTEHASFSSDHLLHADAIRRALAKLDGIAAASDAPVASACASCALEKPTEREEKTIAPLAKGRPAGTRGHAQRGKVLSSITVTKG